MYSLYYISNLKQSVTQWYGWKVGGDEPHIFERTVSQVSPSATVGKWGDEPYVLRLFPAVSPSATVGKWGDEPYVLRLFPAVSPSASGKMGWWTIYIWEDCSTSVTHLYRDSLGAELYVLKGPISFSVTQLYRGSKIGWNKCINVIDSRMVIFLHAMIFFDIHYWYCSISPS